MKLVVLGLKEKKSGNYFVYDVTHQNKHIPLAVNETKTIETLAPFPFSNFSSLDTFNERMFERCYLEVEGELSESEFSSMKSSGIMYHRFAQREVTLINEYENIFQYSLQMLNKFGKNLGTYDLLTWVIHNETKNEDEYNAMKKIIVKAVEKKENKDYPLDISLDRYTIVYMDLFRELSEKGYKITFGRYGSNDEALFENENLSFSNETFLYILQHVRLYHDSFLEHRMFTPDFYEEFIKGKAFEEELFYGIEPKNILALKEKGFDIDELYQSIFYAKLKTLNRDFPEYNGDFFQLFTDPDFAPYTKRTSPFDYYCCEDCDGYDIYELYSEEELEGEEIEVDERLEYVQKLIGQWGEFLSSKSVPLFEKVPDDILEKFTNYEFFRALLVLRKEHQN